MASEQTPERRSPAPRTVVAAGMVIPLILVLVVTLARQGTKPTRRPTVVATTSSPSPTGTTTVTPSASPGDTLSPSESPSSTAPVAAPTGSASEGAPASSLGPPAAGDPVPAVSTIVYVNGPATIQVYGAADAGKPGTRLPGHNSIDQPSAFLVLDQQPGWFHVLLPVKPNGSSGWLKASDVQVATTNHYLRVTVSQFRIDDYVDGTWQAGYRVAVGKPSTPTPTGLYYILASQAVSQAPYTPGIFALSGFAPQPIPGFLGATLGLHGWTDSSVIGTRASNGCIRLASKDMDPLLHSLLLGTPVDIVA